MGGSFDVSFAGNSLTEPQILTQELAFRFQDTGDLLLGIGGGSDVMLPNQHGGQLGERAFLNQNQLVTPLVMPLILAVQVIHEVVVRLSLMHGQLDILFIITKLFAPQVNPHFANTPRGQSLTSRFAKALKGHPIII